MKLFRTTSVTTTDEILLDIRDIYNRLDNIIKIFNTIDKRYDKNTKTTKTA